MSNIQLFFPIPFQIHVYRLNRILSISVTYQLRYLIFYNGFKLIQIHSKFLTSINCYKLIQFDSDLFRLIQIDSIWFKLIQVDSN